MTSTTQTVGYVYFAGRPSNHLIKIGWTAKLGERLSRLQQTCCQRISILVAVRGTVRDERLIHNDFVRDNVRGEWFWPTQRLLDLVNELTETGKLPEKYIADHDPPCLLTRGKLGWSWTPERRANASKKSKAYWDGRREREAVNSQLN